MRDALPEQSASFVVEEGRTDGRGRLSPEGLSDLFQEAASRDAERRGAGMRGFGEAGLAWVLQRMRVEVDLWPTRGRKIAVTTWPTRFGGAMAERAFTVEDASGQPLARAMSRWAMVDLRARRAVRLPEAVRSLPVPARPAPLSLGSTKEPHSVPTVGDAGGEITTLGECLFLVQETDLHHALTHGSDPGAADPARFLVASAPLTWAAFGSLNPRRRFHASWSQS